MSINYTSKYTNRMYSLNTRTATIDELETLLASNAFWISQRHEMNAKQLLKRLKNKDN